MVNLCGFTFFLFIFKWPLPSAALLWVAASTQAMLSPSQYIAGILMGIANVIVESNLIES
ncbi:MAG: putative membrane protein [Moritella sp.]